MERILCFSASEEFKKRLEGIENVVLTIAESTEDLARLAVDDPTLTCVVINVREADDFWIGFLRSMGSHLPILPLLLILDGGSMPDLGSTVEIIIRRPLDPEIFAWIEALLRTAGRRGKRSHQRFDWPLKGTLHIGDVVRVFRVREIGAGGAFLECADDPPEPGTYGTILIEFQDFSVLSSCLTLPMRSAAGRFPAGFGVQFTDLTEWSRKVIDRIVSDELVRQLLNPGVPPHQPTIESLPLTTYESD
jgi:hypothetical protein